VLRHSSGYHFADLNDGGAELVLIGSLKGRVLLSIYEEDKVRNARNTESLAAISDNARIDSRELKIVILKKPLFTFTSSYIISFGK
jgi:ABC-type transporter Mla MlaB component